MLTKREIDIINTKFLSKKVFKYTGEIIPGVGTKADVDFIFKITGYKKMMSVGEYYDYMLIDVVIVGLNDSFSRLVFGYFKDVNIDVDFSKVFESKLYLFWNNLSLVIKDFLLNFDTDIRVTINDVKFDLKESITESNMSRMSRNAVRTTVRDILNIIKDKKSGMFTLPESGSGEEYSFTNLPFGYSVDLFIYHDEELDGFSVDGSFSSEDDVIEIGIKYNPNNLKKYIYDIIGELNDIIAHELEHGFQFLKEGKIYKKKPSKSLSYYTQPDEIKAQRVGLRRLAKLKKLPFESVVSEWFLTHKDVHGLTESEVNKVIKKIMND